MKLKHYLIASEHNDYKPWVIKPVALAVFCLIIASLRIIVPANFTLAAPSIDPTDLMNKINEQRSSRFLSTLKTNSKLITAANGKASDMIARSYFAHIDPDGNYVWPRIESAGFTPYVTLGENLAMDFTSASSVVEAWMNSPTHRANIINEKFEEQGLASPSGMFESNHETIMVVSLFGTLLKKASASPTPAPTPKPTPSPVTPPPIASPTSTPPATPPAAKTSLEISKDIKIVSTSLSGQVIVDIDVIISGEPTLATARLNSQSISLIPGKVSGQFTGSFTFDQSENLSASTLTIEARDKAGKKIDQEFPVSVEKPVTGGSDQQALIPTSSESQIIKVLRIIFGIFAAIYMLFLLIDAIIIHRDKINRDGIRPNSHLLVFAILTAVTLFTSWL